MANILQIVSLLFSCAVLRIESTTGLGDDSDRRCDGGCGSNHLQELSFMISPEDFLSKFVHRHKPVLMRNATPVWPALEEWSENYFLEAYNKHPTVSVVEGTSDLHDAPFHLTAAEFFHRYRNNDLTLVEKIDDHSQLLKDIIVPLCLCCKRAIQDLQVSYSLRGNKQPWRAPLHVGEKEQLISVVKGSLQVSFLSAKYSPELWSAEKPQEALENFPPGRSGNPLPVITTNLNEGDFLYVPQMWWRQLKASGSPSLVVHFEWLDQQWARADPPSVHNIGENVGNNLNHLSQLLRVYEDSFSTREPVKLQCTQQDRRMSEYVFETGKMDPEEYERIHNGPDYRDKTELCAFDTNNKESPCSIEMCVEEPESEDCIIQALDYCYEWDDRGCAEELPNLLNKVNGEVLRAKMTT